MHAIILPITSLDEAKTRQSTCLNSSQRKELVRSMMQDVASQLASLKSRVSILMVTPDREMMGFGLEQGWDVLFESDSITETYSVDRASARLERRGFTHVLRIPADIPMVRASDLDDLLERSVPTPGAVLIPSLEGTGTNAILRSPPTVFPSRFGPDSLRLHLREAKKRDVPVEVVENPRIALDLDTSQDLVRFLKEGDPALSSHQLVSRWAEASILRPCDPSASPRT